MYFCPSYNDHQPNQVSATKSDAKYFYGNNFQKCQRQLQSLFLFFNLWSSGTLACALVNYYNFVKFTTKMGVLPEIQAEATSLVHQFLLNVDKSLAQEFLKKTKAVSKFFANQRPRVGWDNTCWFLLRQCDFMYV